MLKDINNRRPDRQLERNLVFLAYAIMFMSLSLFALFIYPQYYLYIIISIVIWNILCILITIRVLKVSETAIGFGTLAAAVLADKNKYCRIDNANGEAILINKAAETYLANLPVLTFLQKNIIDSPANKLDLQKLEAAVNKLQEATVTISINPSKNSVFVAEEWLRVTVKPITLNKTKIFEDNFSLQKIRKEIYLFWTIENITAYKNMDQVFKNEMSSLYNFLDNLTVGLYSCDDQKRIEYINNSLAEMLGTDKNDAIGKTIDDFVAYKSEILHNATGKYDDSVVFKTVNGTREVLVRQQNIRENNELKTRGVVIWNLPNDADLQQRLNQITDYMECLFSTAPIGIIFTDANLIITEANSYVGNIFEKDGAQLINSLITDYFAADIKNKIIATAKEFLENHGAMFSAETALTFTKEEKNVRIMVYPRQMHYAADAGTIDGFIFYIMDTTNRRNLEMQVAQAQKMQAFGQLAGGVAHDFNNLLTAVIGYCDLLLHRHGIGDPSFSDLLQLKYNVNQAAGVARQLLAISRKQPLNPKIIDVTEAVSENEHLISRLLGEQIELRINYGDETGFIRVDPVQFSQVLINLAINAKDAMEGQGKLTISTHLEHLNKPYQFGSDTIKPGDFVVISVKDTGCGIPPENIERIFEPFFSTKKNVAGSGTGLGLAMVYGIIRQTEGFLKVDSEVGKGTTFAVYLPAYNQNEKTDATADNTSETIILDKTGRAALATLPKTNMISNSEKVILGLNISQFDSRRTTSHNTEEIKILFVEDEDAVRIVGARGLRQKGYEVVDCISAENAIEHLDKGENFDLMITDMMMPGMSGAELANEVHQRLPQTRIILASGYSEEIARKELAGSQDFYFMSKPYSLDDLHKKVKEVLEQNDQ